MWEKYLYNRLKPEEKALIDKIRQQDVEWDKNQSLNPDIIKFDNYEYINKNFDLIEVQLYSLLKQPNFNRHLYVKEMKLFDELPPRKHLEICIKSFNLAMKEVLIRHKIELITKIQPLEQYLYDELSPEDKQKLKEMDIPESWSPFYIVNKIKFAKYNLKWPMTVGGELSTPVRIQVQAWIAPWVAIPTAATPYYFATSGGCADAAQEFLMNWEESVIQIVLNQLREKSNNAKSE